MEGRTLNFSEAEQYAANLLDWWRPKLYALNAALEEDRDEQWSGLLMAELSAHPAEVFTHLEAMALRRAARMPRRGKAYRLLAATVAMMPREEPGRSFGRRVRVLEPVIASSGEWAHRWLREHRDLVFEAGRIPAASADPTTVDTWVEYLVTCIDESDQERLAALRDLCTRLAGREPEIAASLELVCRAASPRSGFSYA